VVLDLALEAITTIFSVRGLCLLAYAMHARMHDHRVQYLVGQSTLLVNCFVCRSRCVIVNLWHAVLCCVNSHFYLYGEPVMRRIVISIYSPVTNNNSFGSVDLNFDDFFWKNGIFAVVLEYMDKRCTKKINTLACQIKLVSERVLNVWNDMPADTVDFTSLTNFKKSVTRVDVTAHPKCFP